MRRFVMLVFGLVCSFATNAEPPVAAAAPLPASAFTAYLAEIRADLAASPRPLDRELAAALAGMAPAPGGKKTPGGRKAKGFNVSPQHAVVAALAAAPHDVVVQRLGLHLLWIANDHGSAAAAALARLKASDGDNAATWADAITDAVRSQRASEIDSAIRAMAACDHYDSHAAVTVKALEAAYARHPMSADRMKALGMPAWVRTADVPPLLASVLGSTVAAPAVGPALQACEKNPGLADPCASIGRLLMARADTVTVALLGKSFVRAAGRPLNEDDRAAMRQVDWLMLQNMRWANRFHGDRADLDAAVLYLHRWQETGNEQAALRQGLAEASLPVSPPADWLDPDVR